MTEHIALTQRANQTISDSRLIRPYVFSLTNTFSYHRNRAVEFSCHLGFSNETTNGTYASRELNKITFVGFLRIRCTKL
jgi:hypothetical protein